MITEVNDLDLVIEELKHAATIIADVTAWLERQVTVTASPATSTVHSPANPENAKPTLTLEQVRAILADKSRAGHTAAVRELLQKHGASRLSEVDPAHYESILKEAEGFTNAT